MAKLKVTSVALTVEQIDFCKSKGNISRYIRSLLDREMGNEQASERWRVIVTAYQNVLQKQKESGEPDS